MSIKTFVTNCLGKGMTVNETWQAAQKEFYPLRVVGWNYVQKLARDYQSHPTDTGSVT